MHSSRLIAFAALLGLCSFASADLLWDNYAVPDGWDHVTGLSSERATLISDTWVVDDAVFDGPVSIDALQWIGFRDGAIPLVSADVIVLDPQFQVVAELHDLPFTSTTLGEQFNLEVYEGTVQVDPIVLDAGQYFIGTRLVGENLGRNFAATSGTGAENVNGLSQAFFKGVPFGADDWTPVQDILSSGQPSDFAFRVNGTAIPEPATLLLLALGTVAVMLRRR